MITGTCPNRYRDRPWNSNMNTVIPIRFHTIRSIPAAASGDSRRRRATNPTPVASSTDSQSAWVRSTRVYHRSPCGALNRASVSAAGPVW